MVPDFAVHFIVHDHKQRDTHINGCARLTQYRTVFTSCPAETDTFDK